MLPSIAKPTRTGTRSHTDGEGREVNREFFRRGEGGHCKDALFTHRHQNCCADTSQRQYVETGTGSHDAAGEGGGAVLASTWASYPGQFDMHSLSPPPYNPWKIVFEFPPSLPPSRPHPNRSLRVTNCIEKAANQPLAAILCEL